MKYTIREKKFTPLEWSVLVASIAEGYFDDGEYTPHFGILNVMRLFFNECVEKVGNKKAVKSESLDDIERFVNDPDFIAEFNKVIFYDDDKFIIDMTFEYAYQTAMGIVAQRTTSWGELTNILIDVIKKVAAYAKDLASEENIQLLQELSKKLSDGGITADAIVEAYGKSGLMDRLSKA